MTSRTGSVGWDLRKVCVLSFSVRRRRLTFGARRGLAVGAARGGGGGGGRWKSQHRKIVYHSSYVEKPFNSKVIKSFVPELRSRKCFLCFGIPMLSIYELWTFYVHFTYPYHGYVTKGKNPVLLSPAMGK